MCGCGAAGQNDSANAWLGAFGGVPVAGPARGPDVALAGREGTFAPSPSGAGIQGCCSGESSSQDRGQQTLSVAVAVGSDVAEAAAAAAVLEHVCGVAAAVAPAWPTESSEASVRGGGHWRGYVAGSAHGRRGASDCPGRGWEGHVSSGVWTHWGEAGRVAAASPAHRYFEVAAGTAGHESGEGGMGAHGRAEAGCGEVEQSGTGWCRLELGAGRQTAGGKTARGAGGEGGGGAGNGQAGWGNFGWRASVAAPEGSGTEAGAGTGVGAGVAAGVGK